MGWGGGGGGCVWLSGETHQLASTGRLPRLVGAYEAPEAPPRGLFQGLGSGVEGLGFRLLQGLGFRVGV